MSKELANMFSLVQGLVNDCLSEEETLLSVWNNTTDMSKSFKFFCEEYNISLKDFLENEEGFEDSQIFCKLMHQNLSQVDSGLWKDIQTLQQHSLEKKNLFFEKEIFKNLSQNVFESFQFLCILELNRLIYLFRGIRNIFSNQELTTDSQSYYDIFSNLISFLKGD
jgi:hypothetical protein